MGTRCTVHFHYGDNTSEAIVYRHWDGSPRTMLPDLERFFQAVTHQASDTRFSDPSYLAAKFVVWQADQNAKRYNGSKREYEKTEPLDFLSVGVCLKDPADIAFRYHVHCGLYTKEGTPTVGWEDVPFQ